MRCAQVGGTPTGTLELYRTAGSSTGQAACPPARVRPSTFWGRLPQLSTAAGRGRPGRPARQRQQPSPVPRHRCSARRRVRCNGGQATTTTISSTKTKIKT